jgi:AraC-like DNA-binding protein
MRTSILSADGKMATATNYSSKVSILKYNSVLTTTNSKIELKQHLFSFLLEGSKSVQYAETGVSINPDQFLLLSAGNCLMSEKTAAPNGHYRSILLFFDKELLIDFFVRHPQKGQFIQGKRAGSPFLVFEKDGFLINFVNSLSFFLTSGQSLSEELKKIKLEELLLYIGERYPEIITRMQQGDYEHGDLLIRQAVNANIYNSITVEELAFLCYMSLSTFKRRFAKIYGSSPSKWLLDKRMRKAAEMLKQSNLKATDIYLELGYENLSSFIQSFKQAHGTTPKQYQLNSLNV